MSWGLFCGLIAVMQAVAAPGPGLWSPSLISTPPTANWGARDGLVQPVYYSGEPYQGKPTRIFAYVGWPAHGHGPFPGILLVHGGGGEAFRAWAEYWAQRGYVALAMDTAGHGPVKNRLPDGGPEQDDDTKFKPFTSDTIRETWTYHAVAAVLRGHALLASLPEVDADRIGVTGISWGGYLTCIVAGVDPRLKVAVPVYGCGFLGDNSYWKTPRFDRMTPELRSQWLSSLDPSAYLSAVRCPILFLNGTSDFAYPLDSYKKSVELVAEPLRTVSVQVALPHGHIWTFPEVDAFIDHSLRGTDPLLRVVRFRTEAGADGLRAVADIEPQGRVAKAEMHFTSESGSWQSRRWQTVPAEVVAGRLQAKLPESRPLVFFVSVVDTKGRRTSSLQLEIGP